MKAIKNAGLLGVGLVSFAVLGPFAIFPAIAGLAYISKLAEGYHEVYQTELEPAEVTA
ncbi:hypothetical protein [Thermosulfurimonas marina]|uniref:hypothetical protein n=1 Tax=Thermosulfurimonas marina TaxID=2047767 RepID=UPI00144AE45F|nr:hypothetical protein [Thermosulfurimonas marina]